MTSAQRFALIKSLCKKSAKIEATFDTSAIHGNLSATIHDIAEEASLLAPTIAESAFLTNDGNSEDFTCSSLPFTSSNV